MNGNSKYGVEVDVESVGEGSEVEFNQKGHTQDSRDPWNGEGIQVKTDVELRIQEVRRQIEKETVKVQSRQEKWWRLYIHGLVTGLGLIYDFAGVSYILIPYIYNLNRIENDFILRPP